MCVCVCVCAHACVYVSKRVCVRVCEKERVCFCLIVCVCVYLCSGILYVDQMFWSPRGKKLIKSHTIKSFENVKVPVVVCEGRFRSRVRVRG